MKVDGHGVPRNVASGNYKPVDWKREVAIRLDDGKLITMFKNRIRLASPAKNESLKETRCDNDPSGCSDIEKEAEPCSLHDLVEAWQDEGYSIALVDIASNKVIDPYVDPSDYPGLMFKGCRNGSASTDGKYRIVFHSGQLKAGKDWFSHNESKSYINKMSNGVILDSRELAGMCYTGQVVEQTMNSAAKNDLIRAMKRSGFSEEEFNSHNAADGLTEAHSGSGFFRREPSEFETPGGGPVTKYECPSCHAVFSNKGYLSAKEKYGSGPCPNCRYTPKHRKSEAMRKKRIPKPGYLEKMRKSKEETSVRNESIEMLIAREGFDGLWYLVDSRNNRLGTFKKWEDAEKEAKELGYNVRPEPRSSAPPAIPAKNRRARKPS